MTKIEQIQFAISEANFFRSKLTPEALAVPGMTSLKIRALMNNLGAISTSYLEVGVHKGGTFCSTVFQNDNLITATAIDNYSEFNEGSPMQEFLDNAGKFKPGKVGMQLMMKDCWEVTNVPKEIDLYLYDGNHSLESQRMACTHFLDSMADEFIFCVDDFSLWPQVKQGVSEGMKGFTILFAQELWDGQESNNFGWHNGFYVALIKKV